MMSSAAFGSWTGNQPEKPETVTTDNWGVIEAGFAEIRDEFVDEYGFVPTCINPDGTPRRKGEL